MWPLDRAHREHVRIGVHAIERWAGSPSRFECVDSRALVAPSRALEPPALASRLEDALVSLYAPKPPSGAVTLLLESALMPTLLVEVGAALWKPAEVMLLVRHRLGALYGRPGVDTFAWDVRIDHRAGERCALGYGLPVTLREALARACTSAGVRCRRVLPSFAWGLKRVDPARRWPERRGWFAWPEQDRTLLSYLEDGRAVTLNSAVAPCEEATQVLRYVAIECVRRGVQCDGPILATRWRAPTGDVPARQVGPEQPAPAVTWADIGAAAGAGAATAPPPRANITAPHS